MKYLTTGYAAALLLLAAARPQAATAQSWAGASAAPNSTATESWAEKVAFDAAGNVVVAGLFAGMLVLGNTTLVSAGGENVFVACLSSAGAWTQAVRAGGSRYDWLSAVAVDAQGRAVVAGSGPGAGE